MSKFIWQNGSQIEPAKVQIGDTSYEVTPAQYEGETPLSAANLNTMVDNTYSDLQEYADNSPIKNNVYSTEEKVIGTWIDGKPLYRKVITIAKNMLSSGTSTVILHNISNLDKFISLRGFLVRTDNMQFDFPHITVSNHDWDIYFGDNNATKISIWCGQSLYAIFGQGFVILEYTKTTD